MKTKLFITIASILIGSAVCSTNASAMDFNNTFTENMIVDDSRSSFNLGSCKDLSEDPYTVFLFLDDNESSWTETEVSEFWYNSIETGYSYLETEAARYGVDLELEKAGYATDPSHGISLKYNGIVTANLMEESVSHDIFDQAAASLGFSSVEDMNQYLQSYSGKSQVAYVIALDKPGRSYAHPAQAPSHNSLIEYCVVFSSNLNSTVDTSAATIAHEVLHLFGAEDYYDPYGTTPKRAELAKTLYPNDIMHITATDVNTLTAGAFTAYTVGWTDTLPSECNNADWWQ